MARPLSRWLLLAACALVALVVARPARAAAPICDERGMSAIAPPPVLPVADVRLESAPSGPVCLEADLGLDGVAVAIDGVPVPPHDPPTPIDGAMASSMTQLARFRGEALPREADEAAPVRSGFARGVFHPPRA
jgi:hypothetical protein